MPSPIDPDGDWRDEAREVLAVAWYRKKHGVKGAYDPGKKPDANVIRENWRQIRRSDLTTAELALAVEFVDGLMRRTISENPRAAAILDPIARAFMDTGVKPAVEIEAPPEPEPPPHSPPRAPQKSAAPTGPAAPVAARPDPPAAPTVRPDRTVAPVRRPGAAIPPPQPKPRGERAAIVNDQQAATTTQDSPEDAIAQQFLAVRAAMWAGGGGPASPMPILRSQAHRALEGGLTVNQILRHIGVSLTALASANEAAPMNLDEINLVPQPHGVGYPVDEPEPAAPPVAQERPGRLAAVPEAPPPRPSAPAKPAGAPASSVNWSTFLGRLVETGGAFWPEEHLGPKPGKPGCRVPAEAIAEYRPQLEQLGVIAPAPPPRQPGDNAPSVQSAEQLAALQDQTWDTRVRYLIQRETWLEDWGPQIGEPGCQVPDTVVAKYGMELYDMGVIEQPPAPAAGAPA